MIDQTRFLVDLDHTLYNVEEKKLYSDAIELIKFLKIKGEVILFTEGNIDFQKEKIKRLNLKELFGKDILVFSSFSKMKDIDSTSLEGKTILIDDNPEIIRQAKIRGWKTIRVKRGRHKDVETDADYTVTDLKTIENLNL